MLIGGGRGLKNKPFSQFGLDNPQKITLYMSNDTYFDKLYIFLRLYTADSHIIPAEEGDQRIHSGVVKYLVHSEHVAKRI